MRKCWLWYLLPLIFVACAQVGQISGGEKDEQAPQLVLATPPNGTVQFNAKAFRLEFDERVQLEKVRERLLISPPLEKLPEVRIVGARSVEVSITSELKENTTYSFNLAECVKDLTEGNLATGVNYVFSTGAVLDSIRVEGIVRNSLTDAPEKHMLVMLHAVGDTGAFRAGRPLYLARTREDGTFVLDHLSASEFSLFALRDKNSNFKYDLPNEEIAFLDSVLVLPTTDTTVSSLHLRAFLPRSSKQQIRAYTVIPDGAFQLVFAKAADSVVVRDVERTGGTLFWKPEWNNTRDTVLLWPNDTTLLAKGSYVISDGGMVLDTLNYRRTKPMSFNTGITATSSDEKDNVLISLRAARPIREVDSTRFVLERDSTAIPFELERSLDNDRTLILTAKLDAGETARLTIYPKAVRDIYGGVNDTLRTSMGRTAESATGSLRVNLTGLDSASQYVVQMLTGQDKVVREAAVPGNAPHMKWERLAPGMVTLRLFQDSNSNGHWDTGEWAAQQQPEPVWNHKEPVNVRAAWDVVVDWGVE
ncbi:MAG: Ig-like domain-containing protein [Flavobacteriales bacterium]|nr:Ig-like domain-containing protein [Flavobacteriales bacterium]